MNNINFTTSIERVDDKHIKVTILSEGGDELTIVQPFRLEQTASHTMQTLKLLDPKDLACRVAHFITGGSII